MEAGKVPRRSLQQTSVSDVPKSKKSTTAPLDIRAEGLPGTSTEKRKTPAAKGRDGDEIRVYQAVDPAQSRASTSIEEPETKDSPKAEQNPQIGRDSSRDLEASLLSASTKQRKLPRTKRPAGSEKPGTTKDQSESSSSGTTPVKPENKSRLPEPFKPAEQLQPNNREPQINRDLSQRARSGNVKLGQPAPADNSRLPFYVEEYNDEDEEDNLDYDIHSINYDSCYVYCDDKKYDCQKCGEVCMDRKELLEHENYLCCVCEYCNEQFDEKNELDEHRIEAHTSEGYGF